MTLTPLVAALLFLWMVFIVFWRVMAMFVKPTAKRAPFFERIAYNIPFFLAFAALLMSFGSWAWVPLASIVVAQTKFSIVLGIGLTAFGLAVSIWSRIALGSNWSHTIVLVKEHKLVTHGPYAYMRHPIYTGLLLMFFGTAVALGTLGGMIGFGLMFVSCWVKLISEERLMIREFPHEYLHYSRRVKRLIPYFL
ncbi:MAG: isoprenylcysteine carboxylmethyltransferase family protein [Patescibacteria group bacterium]